MTSQNSSSNSGALSESDLSSAAPVILIVDDDAAMRLIMQQALERDGYRLLEAVNGEEALAICEDTLPDLVLMDAVMPVMDGFEACRRLQQAHSNIPVLIVTGINDYSSVEQAFRAGARDFIPKPIHWAILRQRVARLLAVSHAERHITHLANHDTLTGLPNRQVFMDRFGAILSRVRRKPQLVALLRLELKNLHEISVAAGHGADDFVLCTVAERLIACIREGDTVARINANTFAIIVETIQRVEDVSIIAEKIIAVLTGSAIIENPERVLNVDIGIALYPEDGVDMTTLMDHAKTALDQAKQTNNVSNNYQFYNQPHIMSAESQRRLVLATDFQKALEKEELELYYQPRYRLQENMKTSMVGVEALVRWNHPQLGMIYPNEFIPLAEELNSSAELGEWVLRQACKEGQWLQQQSSSALRVAVNLSVRQFKQLELHQLLSQILQETGLKANLLELELLEKTVMDDTESLLPSLQKLHELGVRLMINEFACGHLSFDQLRRLPVDAIEIDNTFVAELPNNSGNVAIVKSILEISRNFSLTPVAVGVENNIQLQFLYEQGCQEIQGFLFSKPMPLRALPLP